MKCEKSLFFGGWIRSTIKAEEECRWAMIEIRQLPEGRFEVFAAGRHSEAFEGSLGAIAAAHALAAMLAQEQNAPV